MNVAKQFMDLFHGLEKAHGIYGTLVKTRADGKQVAKQIATVKRPVTVELWREHLAGREGIGIVPINDESECMFGAIDIDSYQGLELKDLAARIFELNLPLVTCRSKSGGAHLYLFTKEWVSAKLMQEKLKEFAAVLGFGTSEIYPKQTEILADRGDIGQWINMPYFDNIRGGRYGVKTDGQPYTPEEFIEYAVKKRQTFKQLDNLAVVMAADLEDGPPCLQYLTTQGFPEGTRNDGLFNLGVYVRMKYPDDWEKRIDSFNVKYMVPPLTSTEVQGVVKSVKKKDYFYTCNKPPVQPHCNSTICRIRKFGAGSSGTMPIISGLTKYNSNPPLWFMDVDGGGRLELNTDDLQNQPRFQKRCMDCLNMMPSAMNKNMWVTLVQNLLDNVVIIEAPVDASAEGQLLEMLERFCTSRAQASTREEILLGKPYLEEGRHYFRISDFLAFLERQKFRDYKVHLLTATLLAKGGQHHFLNTKTKGINVWSFPEFVNQQTEGFEVKDYNKDLPY